MNKFKIILIISFFSVVCCNNSKNNTEKFDITKSESYKNYTNTLKTFLLNDTIVHNHEKYLELYENASKDDGIYTLFSYSEKFDSVNIENTFIIVSS